MIMAARRSVPPGQNELFPVGLARPPTGARRRAELEARMGHRFRQDLSMAEIVAAAEAAGPAGCSPVEDWTA